MKTGKSAEPPSHRIENLLFEKVNSLKYSWKMWALNHFKLLLQTLFVCFFNVNYIITYKKEANISSQVFIKIKSP